jgi:hypothetical protein
LNSKASRKGGDERKKKSQRKCYECGEYWQVTQEQEQERGRE